MSLISEALKRTQQNTGLRSRQPPTARPSSSPAASTLRGTSRSLLWTALVGTVVVTTIAVFVLWRLRLFLTAHTTEVAAVALADAAPRLSPKPAEAATLTSVVPKGLETVLRVVPPVELPKAGPPPVESAKPEPAKPEPAPPPPPPPRELPKLVLQGITIYGNVREALINGQTVTIGDVIEEATVVGIETRSVKLRFDGREWILRLP